MRADTGTVYAVQASCCLQNARVHKRSRSLSDGEVVVMRLRPHGRALVLPAVALVVAMGVAGFAAAAARRSEQAGLLQALVAILLLAVVLRTSVVPFLRWRTTTLTVTDRRVSTRQGLLRSRTRDVALWRVADVVVERGLVQRLLGSGTLLLDTTGERGAIEVHDLPGVQRVARELGELLDARDLPDDQDALDDDRDDEGRDPGGSRRR